MDAFEQLVGEILWRDGYWVQQCVKVELTKEEKKQINRAISPRWEIDLVAYKGTTNELLLVECKSYLDSRGVTIAALNGSNEKSAKRFKLFHDATLFSIVVSRLVKQLAQLGACPENVTTKLCLVAGRISSSKDREQLHTYFSEKGWQLWDEGWLREKLKGMAAGGYENSVAAVTAKLLLRP